MYNSCLLILCASVAICQAVDTTTLSPSTTTSKEQNCQSKIDCGSCVSQASCLWCESKKEGEKCILYPKKSILPSKDVCPLGDARWGTCWVNYKALIITMSVIAGVIILAIASCCIYCCCCRSRANQRRRLQVEDAREIHEDEARRARHEERRAERQTKYDEIRRKYGLTQDASYQRFENDE